VPRLRIVAFYQAHRLQRFVFERAGIGKQASLMEAVFVGELPIKRVVCLPLDFGHSREGGLQVVEIGLVIEFNPVFARWNDHKDRQHGQLSFLNVVLKLLHQQVPGGDQCYHAHHTDEDTEGDEQGTAFTCPQVAPDFPKR